MPVPEVPPSLEETITSISTQIQVLGIAGFAGSVLRSLHSKEWTWKQKLLQALSGAATSVFLGGYVAKLLEVAIGEPTYALLAGGFLAGVGGMELAVAVQRKILK